MDKLVEEEVLSKTGGDIYTIKERKKFDYEFNAVKEEADCRVVPVGGKAPHGRCKDRMYMKALYYALPMDYITVAKLQTKLEGEANQTTVRKLIDKMSRDGFVEAQSNRRLGKRVIHSDLTERKLSEVKKVLQYESMDVVSAPNNKHFQLESRGTGINQMDTSTCGVLHSIGSDLTRMKLKSDLFQNGSIRSEQTISKTGDSPTSRPEPVTSRESFAPGKDNNRGNGNTSTCGEGDMLICSRSSQDKRSRKSSTVNEPIIQYMKRQKSQAP